MSLMPGVDKLYANHRRASGGGAILSGGFVAYGPRRREAQSGDVLSSTRAGAFHLVKLRYLEGN